MNINDYNKVIDRLSPSAECRNEVLNMKKQRKNIKLNKKGIAVIVAAAVAACGGTAVYAAEKISSFKKLKESKNRTVPFTEDSELPMYKGDNKDYEIIENAAEVLPTAVAAESDNISLNMDSVYCDGTSVILGVTGNLADGNPENYDIIHLNPNLLINNEYVSSENILETDGYMLLDENTDNSFTGSITFILSESAKLSDTAEITVEMKNICGSETYYSDQFYIGSASLTAEVTPEIELVENYGNCFEKDGYSFTIYDISPAMMTAGYTYPKNTDAHIIAMIYDENGNRLERAMDEPVEISDGIWAETFIPPVTNNILVKFCDKQRSDENNMPVVMCEMTIDLENLTVVE